jgi:hypothetical protein
MVVNDSVLLASPIFVLGAFAGRGLGLKVALGMENDDVLLRGPVS